MAKKRKKKFSAVKAVKAAAREQVGAPRPTRRDENPKKAAAPKYKPTLGKLLEQE